MHGGAAISSDASFPFLAFSFLSLLLYFFSMRLVSVTIWYLIFFLNKLVLKIVVLHCNSLSQMTLSRTEATWAFAWTVHRARRKEKQRAREKQTHVTVQFRHPKGPRSDVEAIHHSLSEGEQVLKRRQARRRLEVDKEWRRKRKKLGERARNEASQDTKPSASLNTAMLPSLLCFAQTPLLRSTNPPRPHRPE